MKRETHTDIHFQEPTHVAVETEIQDLRGKDSTPETEGRV